MPKFFFRSIAALMVIFLAWSLALPAHADMEKIRQSGALKVAVYDDLAPFSAGGRGIDIELAEALAKKLGLKLALLSFPAGENLGDDLRNMVWKGHYLGYGPADVLLHVPVDRHLIANNPKVEIFAPYYRDAVQLVRRVATVPNYDGLASLAGKKIGVEKISIAAVVLLGEEGGKYREQVRIYPTAVEALAQLQAGAIDAVLANRSEIESAVGRDPNYQVHDVSFPRLPRQGWVVGMAVKKDQIELARLLQAASDELTASGELAKIFSRHGVAAIKP
ncbi:substrate-binding periplasmic protein [Noviherbaspirillum sedimenti]|nr:transporter substrate-binding domain-containing protein [Noviherbaspirillum sedimenti]